VAALDVLIERLAHDIRGEAEHAHAARGPVIDSPKPPAQRLTMTLPLLTSAGRVIVMALGTSKAAVMQEALTSEDSMLPISLVLRRAQQSLVLLDEDAARV
jgi:6-phosphogluconolactonase